ncbi:MAG: T9SS type A sorting domain-containing protein [candidate division Zixibacteria bacterium]|nr:T9SS type A sorting domain-containing protein [candidate division Zixibacteria bacterium]
MKRSKKEFVFQQAAGVIVFILVLTSVVFAEIYWTEHIVGNIWTCWTAVAVDFDQDNDVDVLGSSTFDHQIIWWENDGTENFTQHFITEQFDSATDIHVIDLDRDGDMDVLGMAFFGDVAWWENDGNMNFTRNQITEEFNRGYDLYALDVDNDEDIDFVGAFYKSSPSGIDISWWENNGNEHFTMHEVDSDFNGAVGVHAIDMENDGDIDILGAALADNKISWWENDGQQNFTVHEVATNFKGARDAYAEDLDRDGDIDIIALAQDLGLIVWWENDGSQQFTGHLIDENLVGPWDVCAEDLDGDDDFDILVADYNGDETFYYENDGEENFVKLVMKSNFDGAKSVYAFDIDTDGDMDFLGSACWENELYWWENDTVSSPGMCMGVNLETDPDPVEIYPGDSFRIFIYIDNPSEEPITSDIWLGWYFNDEFLELYNYYDVPLDAGGTNGTNWMQPISQSAQAGTYRFVAYTGAYSEPCDSAWFEFVVLEQEGFPDVGLVVSDYDGDWTEVSDLLFDTGQVSSVTFVDARYSTPLVSELLDYDVLMVWSNHDFANATALGDNLADYVDAGGAVVTTQFAHHTDRRLRGRYMSDYSPLGHGSSRWWDASLRNDDPDHPIMDGVSSGSEGNYFSADKQGNWHQVQHWRVLWSNYSGTVVNQDYPQCVAINGYFGASEREWAGDVGRMMTNAVLYAHSQAPGIWLNSQPPSPDWAEYYRPAYSDQPSENMENNSVALTEVLKEQDINEAQLNMPVFVDAHPNPFNAQTKISYKIPEAGRVNISVYNIMGQKVGTIVDEYKEIGVHEITWDASNLSSGIYFYRLETGEINISRRMTLLK